MSDEQNASEPVEVQPEPTTEPQPETPQEPAQEPPVDESAPTDTEPPADEPEAAGAQDGAPQIPEALTDVYENVRVVTLTGGTSVVLAKASPLSTHNEQRISGEFPTAEEALTDAQRIVKLQLRDHESAEQSNAK